MPRLNESLNINSSEPFQLSAGDPYRQDYFLELHNRFGYSPHGLIGILPNSWGWIDSKQRGAISYLEVGNVWLASDPLASESHVQDVAKRFMNVANARGKIVSFVPATMRLAQGAEYLDMDAVSIGASPYFDLQAWSTKGSEAKKVRERVNQSIRAGVAVEELRGGDISKAELSELCNGWLDTRRSIEFGWLFSLDPLRFSDRKRYFLARTPEGKAVGLLVASPMPVRSGWYLEDVIRHPAAPKGTSELLVVEGMAALARSGSKIATLGTMLAAYLDLGEPVSRGDYRFAKKLFPLACGHMESVYNFKGVRCFKEKFAPSWMEPEFIMFPAGFSHPVRIAVAAARAISEAGLKNAIGKRISAWRRAPNRVVRQYLLNCNQA